MSEEAPAYGKQSEDVTPRAAWDAAVEIAGKWLDWVTVQLRETHLFARRDGEPGDVTVADPSPGVWISVQLMNEKPRITRTFPYSSTTLAGALEHMRTMLPDEVRLWRVQYDTLEGLTAEPLTAEGTGAKNEDAKNEDGGKKGHGE